MDYPKFILLDEKEESISVQMVNRISKCSGRNFTVLYHDERSSQSIVEFDF